MPTTQFAVGTAITLPPGPTPVPRQRPAVSEMGTIYSATTRKAPVTIPGMRAYKATVAVFCTPSIQLPVVRGNILYVTTTI